MSGGKSRRMESWLGDLKREGVNRERERCLSNFLGTGESFWLRMTLDKGARRCYPLSDNQVPSSLSLSVPVARVPLFFVPPIHPAWIHSDGSNEEKKWEKYLAFPWIQSVDSVYSFPLSSSYLLPISISLSLSLNWFHRTALWRRRAKLHHRNRHYTHTHRKLIRLDNSIILKASASKGENTVDDWVSVGLQALRLAPTVCDGSSAVGQRPWAADCVYIQWGEPCRRADETLDILYRRGPSSSSQWAIDPLAV